MSKEKFLSREYLETFIAENWHASVESYWSILAQCSTDYMTKECREQTHEEMNLLVCSLFAWATKVNRIKTGKQEFPSHFNPDGPINASYPHTTAFCQVSLTLWMGNLFVDCDLDPGSSIPNQDEEWWAKISEIVAIVPTKLEGFCLQNKGSAEQRKILKSGRSVIYQIARNYAIKALDQTQENTPVGTLSSAIHLDEPLPKIMEMVKFLVGKYAKISQGLYRSEYQKWKQN